VTDLVIMTDDGPIRTVRMNRPDKKNALTSAMYEALSKAVTDYGSMPTLRCLVLAGVPGAFCAGNDLNDFMAAAQGGEGLSEPIVHLLHALARCEKPLVAAVSGVAVGIGTTMLMHCDHVVAGTDARLQTPFARLGLLPEAASTLLAPRLMGHARAFSLLVMGRPLDAAGAQAAGLVNTVVAPDQVDSEAMKAAQEIAALPPQAVAASRKLMRGDPDEIVRRMDHEVELYKVHLKSPEARAALEAFFTRKR
jgi:enoyl-CoA hydratase/carnithine racemase